MHTKASSEATELGVKQCKVCRIWFDIADMYTWNSHGEPEVGARCVPCQMEWFKEKNTGVPDGQSYDHIQKICADLLEKCGLTSARVRLWRARREFDLSKDEIERCH